MKTVIKAILIIVFVGLTPFIIGYFLPKDRLVIEKTVIDKMYFYILGDITNHWEEPKWRSDIDTLISLDVIDGQDAWMERYNNGDTVLLITQKTTENDYIRLILMPDGHNLNRIITIADFDGKTAIRFTEEAFEGSAIKRFKLLFNDPIRDRIKRYLTDLKEKNEAEEPLTD